MMHYYNVITVRLLMYIAFKKLNNVSVELNMLAMGKAKWICTVPDQANQQTDNKRDGTTSNVCYYSVSSVFQLLIYTRLQYA